MSQTTSSFDEFLKSLFTVKKTVKTPLFTTAKTTPIATTTPKPATPVQQPAQNVIKPTVQPPKASPISNQAIQIKEVAKDLKLIRNSAAFIKNAPKLFQAGGVASSTLMTAQLATQILRECGFDIPREVTLSIAACQVVAAGGTAIQAGSNAAATTGQVAEPTAIAIQAAIALLQETGALKLDAIQVQQVNLALDVALVVSSGGSNIVADVKLVFDLYMAGETSRYLAQYDADKQVRGAISAFRSRRLTAQAQAAAENFDRLVKGEMGMFAFATQIARNSAESFPKFFPEIATFFPPTAIDVLDVEYRSTDRSIFSLVPSGWGHAAGHTEVVMSRTRDQLDMLTKWCEIFLDPCIEGYNRVLGEDIDANINKLGLTSLCIMSMLPPYFKMIPENFDVRAMLLAWNLTPYDFYNDDCVTQEFYKPNSEYIISDIERQIPSPITFNGIEYIYPQLVSQREIQAQRKAMKPGILEANINGDIDFLLRDPDTNALIRDWGKIVDHGPSKFYKDAFGQLKRISGGPNVALPIYPSSDKSLLKNQLNLRNSLLNGNWRNIQNYFSVLSMIEALSSDWKGYSTSIDKENKLRSTLKDLTNKRDLASWKRGDVERMARGYNAVGVYDAYNVEKYLNKPMVNSQSEGYWDMLNWNLFAQGSGSNVDQGFWSIIAERKAARLNHESLKNDVINAQYELDQYVLDAPKREASDAAFARDFKKMVYDRYPQVVADQATINEKYREVTTKMVHRGMNKMAFSNIAKLLKVPVNKLVQVNKGNLIPDGPGLFKGI